MIWSSVSPSSIGEEPFDDARQTVEITAVRVQTSRMNPTGHAVTTPKQPDACETKDDVRAEIDRVDQALLTLFAERHRYVTRMAQIKTDPHEARDPVRIEAVILKVRERSLALDLDEDQAELVWRTLIDWNINYEKGIIAARRRG
jgi:isochorismate pyruvate lyase